MSRNPVWNNGLEYCEHVMLPMFEHSSEAADFMKKLYPESGWIGAIVRCAEMKMKRFVPGDCGKYHIVTGTLYEEHQEQKDFPVVVLTEEEMRRADAEGRLRRQSSKHLHDYNAAEFTKEEDFIEQDINGRAAEIAWCRYSGLPEAAVVGAYRKPDSGRNVQVRSSKLPHGSLIFRRERDSIDHYFVLVIGVRPTFKLAGWIAGIEAKKIGRFMDKNGEKPMQLVSQHQLKPVPELIKILGMSKTQVQ